MAQQVFANWAHKLGVASSSRHGDSDSATGVVSNIHDDDDSTSYRRATGYSSTQFAARREVDRTVRVLWSAPKTVQEVISIWTTRVAAGSNRNCRRRHISLLVDGSWVTLGGNSNRNSTAPRTDTFTGSWENVTGVATRLQSDASGTSISVYIQCWQLRVNGLNILPTSLFVDTPAGDFMLMEYPHRTRVAFSDGTTVRYLPLVEVDDPYASQVRVMTKDGVRAIAGELLT